MLVMSISVLFKRVYRISLIFLLPQFSLVVLNNAVVAFAAVGAFVAVNSAVIVVGKIGISVT